MGHLIEDDRQMLRECAENGMGIMQTVRATGFSYATVKKYAGILGITFPRGKPPRPVGDIVARGYACGTPPRDIAKQAGTTTKIVHVTAHNMGLTMKGPHDPFRYKRGFVIPPERMDEYRELRKTKATMLECGQMMGLVPR